MPQSSVTLAISPDGHLLVPGAPADERPRGGPAFDLAGYAVRDLGFVLLTWTATNCLRIEFRPTLLTDHAVDALCRIVPWKSLARLELCPLAEEAASAATPGYRLLLSRIGSMMARGDLAQIPRSRD